MMYLLHGAGDVESGWTMIGRANIIIDNLDQRWQGEADGRRHATWPHDSELVDWSGEECLPQRVPNAQRCGTRRAAASAHNRANCSFSARI